MLFALSAITLAVALSSHVTVVSPPQEPLSKLHIFRVLARSRLSKRSGLSEFSPGEPSESSLLLEFQELSQQRSVS